VAGRLAAIEKALLASPDKQISLTDPDCRSMETSGRAPHQTLGVNKRRRLTPLLRNISVCYGADRRPDPVPIHNCEAASAPIPEM
jgi:hypothetical protein